MAAEQMAGMMDSALFNSAYTGNVSGVTSALAYGSNINGSSLLPCPPLAAAAAGCQVGMVSFLIKQGADPNTAVNRQMPNPKRQGVLILHGERALHIAAKCGDVEIVRVLTRAGADPNATDKGGCTPLISACLSPLHRAETVRLLIMAGANAALAEGKSGFTPLHVAARWGRTDLIDLLYTGAPAVLNSYNTQFQTPLCLACTEGHESVVSRLLCLGAMQRTPPGQDDLLPLSMAVIGGFTGVVRVLLKEGMGAVGGAAAVLPNALLLAVCPRRTRILQLLLAAEGKERQPKWANAIIGGKSLIQFGAGYCCHTAVSVLLAAGADEAALLDYLEGHPRRRTIGVYLSQAEFLQMDRGKEIAILRMLERGAAYRARSWGWPADEKQDADGCDDKNTAAAVLTSAPAASKPPFVVDVRIFRPQSDRKLFMRLLGRYCEKN